MMYIYGIELAERERRKEEVHWLNASSADLLQEGGLRRSFSRIDGRAD